MTERIKNIRFKPKLWAIIPAAGSGSRFSPHHLKQYQIIAGQTVLEHSIDALYQLPLSGCLVGCHAQDQLFSTLSFHHPVQSCEGGIQRMDTVLAALQHLTQADDQDYVIVHDAARPCLHLEQIQLILDFCQTGEVAAIIAIPVRDSLKQVNIQSYVEHSVDRHAIWQAQTPQIVQYGVLKQALLQAKQQSHLVTDEAQALEQLGYPVRILQGRNDNLKITYPEDLNLAALILTSHRMT